MTPRDDSSTQVAKEDTKPVAKSDPGSSVGDLKNWFEVLKKDYPIAALSVAVVSIGLLLLIISASLLPSIAPGVTLAGNAMLGLGVIGFLVAIIKAAISAFKNS